MKKIFYGSIGRSGEFLHMKDQFGRGLFNRAPTKSLRESTSNLFAIKRYRVI